MIVRRSHDAASCSRRGVSRQGCALCNGAECRARSARAAATRKYGHNAAKRKANMVASALIMSIGKRRLRRSIENPVSCVPGRPRVAPKISGTRSRSPNGAKRNQDALTPLSTMAVPEDHSWRHTECGFRFIRATGPPTYTASGTISCASGAIAAAVRTRPCGVRFVFPPATRSSASG
jgi:hypothetical protein